MVKVDVQKILTSALNEAKSRIQRNMEGTGANASGRTSASIEVSVDGNRGSLTGRQAFYVLEHGRGGGNVPRNFRQIIYQWMQDKGVHAPDISDNSLAYLIARKIAREGTLLHREGGRSDIYSNVLPDIITKIESEITNDYSINIKSIMQWQ